MRRKNNEDVIRKLELEVQQLKSTNRVLRKRIRNLQKTYVKHEEEDEKNETLQEDICQECGKGEIQEIEIVNRRFKTCAICGFRSKAIKVIPNTNS